ncbi:MAG: hypothetical protein PHQ52_01950 [Candidatus Omnitrophica bacterium]|nr:hypothetical protein [Candidatus Omnitrophota bacterium]
MKTDSPFDKIMNLKMIISILSVFLILTVLITIKKVSSSQDYMTYLKKEIGPDLPTEEPKTQTSTLPYLNGYDWDDINKMKASIFEKTSFKISILQIIIETSMFLKKPVVEDISKLEIYISALDTFYSSPDNRMIPVFFAMKVIEMQQQAIPEENVSAYRSLLLEKFNKPTKS